MQATETPEPADSPGQAAVLDGGGWKGRGSGDTREGQIQGPGVAPSGLMNVVLKAMGSHRRVLREGMTWSDLCFRQCRVWLGGGETDEKKQVDDSTITQSIER